MADRLYISQRTDEIIGALRVNTKLDKSILARMAFTYSLVHTGKDVEKSTNFSGSEMRKQSFLNKDELLVKTLVNQVYQLDEIDDKQFFSSKSIVKNHIDNGASILWDLFRKNGEDINKWYAEIVSTIQLSGGKKLKTKD
ncbi:MAG: DndE family protein, partial [Saprospiraceae bacterium]|nr:DndE family protein [Saprospiraceae bacterium]